MSDAFSHSLLCPSLIGRAPMLQTLRRRIDGVRERGAGGVLVAGEAGIGKSRLVAEAKTYALERGHEVLQAVCFPQDRADPYAPLIDLLRARLGRKPPDIARAMIRPFAGELTPLLPEWAATSLEERPPPQGPERSQRRLFNAFAHCLVHHHEPTPILLLVEDLHWCDRSSLDLLLHLLHTTTRPLLLICTYRTGEVGADLSEWLTQMDRGRRAEQLTLGRLSRADVDAMLAAILGDQGRALRRLRHALYDLSEGNPFYVEELLKALVTAGDLFHSGTGWASRPGAELHIPPNLHAAVQHRVASLDDGARQVLTLAAVVGRRFDLALLQRLAQVDEPTLLRSVKELLAAQLVAEETADHFVFRHALTRQAIYDGLLARERRRLHRDVAEAIELGQRGRSDRQAADLAAHYFEAEQWPKALAYAALAGEQAQRLHAPHAAVEHYTRALDAVAHLAGPPGPTGTSGVQLAPAHLALARGQACETLGRFEPARADYEAAIRLAQAAGDRRAEWEALRSLSMLWTGRDYAQAGDYVQRALALARACDDPTLIAHSLNRLGNWHLNRTQPHEAAQLHREALAIFEQVGDLPGMAQTLDLLGMASHLSLDRAESLGHYERAAALFRELQDLYGLSTSLTMSMSTAASTYFRDMLRVEPESVERALRDGELALEQARALDWRAGESFALWAMGTLLGFAGEYGRALDVGQRSLRIAEEIGHQQWQASSHWTLGMTYLDLLAAPRARGHLERALELGEALGSTVWTHQATCCLAVACAQDRQHARAEALIATLLDSLEATAWGGLWMLLWARAGLALARRDPAGAVGILDRFSPPGRDGLGERDTLRMAQLRGAALAALGRHAEAEAVLSVARDCAERQGARPQLWRCEVALGGLLHAQGRHDEARHAFSAAAATIDALAATVPDERLRENFRLRATGHIPRRYSPVSRRAQAARYDGLTAREREVAALVAQGRSNREIAEALVIGERTVETHVSNIFAKLDADSRHQVAVWAIGKGLVAKP